MASFKITNSLRDEVRKRAMRGALDVERAEWQKRREAVADAVYRLLVTEEQEKLMKKLPTGFLVSDDSFHFTPYHDGITMGQGSGRRKDLRLSTDRRQPKFFEAYTIPVVVGLELMEEIAAIEKEDLRLNDALQTLAENVNRVLNSVGTVARLLIVWPEVEKFLPDYATNPKLSNLPAVQVGELNAMLAAAKHEELAAAA